MGGMNQASALPLQQHVSFAATLRRLGQPASIQKVPDAAPVVTLRRFGVSFASRGPIWTTHATADQKIRSLRTSGLRLINADRCDPIIYRNAGFRMISTAASVAELDLTPTPAERRTRAKAKWRNAWRRAQDATFTTKIQPFDPVLHQWLLEADRQQQRQKGFRALPHAILTAYAARSPRQALVFVAQHKRTPIAAMLFLLHRPVASYQLGWNSDVGRRLNAHHGLLFAAADWLHDKRYRRLDLGTVDTETAPDLARFKIGTGAAVRPLGGTWLRLPGL